MHDLIAAQDILKTAVHTAALRDLKQITSVTVRLGTLVQHGQAITPQNLKFNFNLVRKNTVAAKARLIIKKTASNSISVVSIRGKK
ncbi:MAG: hydrogenase/urease maturation nickel metallochaperone HypA [Patescibacteria group bacterium]|nr:hydrogenase/urease maturation nickel metallochaperone HypA [Patescibacteria group bacterium]MDD5715194.1 hydrogenase/urease maturation nickel metallochaperone HypA [Patescibacteria group bacterium]